jgi:hypothetical protein
VPADVVSYRAEAARGQSDNQPKHAIRSRSRGTAGPDQAETGQLSVVATQMPPHAVRRALLGQASSMITITRIG